MDNLLSKANNILIVLPQKTNADILSATVGIINSYKNKYFTICSKNKISQKFNDFFDLKQYKIINNLPEKKIILSINRTGGKIKAVKWQEEKEQTKFFLQPEDGNVSLADIDMDFSIGGNDLIVFVGCSKIEVSGFEEFKNFDLAGDIKILNIDNSPINSGYGDECIVKPQKSISEIVTDILLDSGIEPDKDTAKILFQGMISSIYGLNERKNADDLFYKLNLKSSKILESIEETFDTLSIPELKYIEKLISNLEMHKGDIILSKIKKSDVSAFNPDHTIFPELNIISRLKNYKIALVLFEVDNHVKCRIYAKKPKEINLFKIFADFSPQGNSKNVVFESNENIDNLADKLIKLINENDYKTPDTEKEKINIDKVQTEPLSQAKSYPEPIVPPISNPAPFYPSVPQQQFNQPMPQQFQPQPFVQPLSPAR